MASRFLPGWLVAGLLLPLQGQEPGDELPSLKALLATPVTVASRRPETPQETPGVVTVFTREELLATGARDLLDVLRLVPGFDLGYDVQGVTGPSMRGLWGYEGKILLLWDGVEMNEVLYGTLPLGGRFPLDQIRRIEIIRGPGSSVYGGSAELAVIQITSLGAEEVEGGGAGLTLGRGTDRTTRRTVQALGAWAGPDLSLSAGLLTGEVLRSEGTYTDPTGVAFSLRDQGRIRPLFAHAGLQAGAFEGRVVVEQYLLQQRDDLGVAPDRASDDRFDSVAVDLRYTWRLNPTLTLTPTFSWQEQKPWAITYPAASVFQYTATRKRGGLAFAWDPTETLSFSGGGQVQWDGAQAQVPGRSFFPGGAASVAYRSEALHGQLQVHGPIHLTVGARWERHSEAGSAFVPRLALTRAQGRWHAKLLYAHAFRTPGIMNLNQTLDPTRPIEPERTRTTEVEVGFQGGSSLVTLNVFDTAIRKPLVYTVLPATTGYLNQARTGTRGFEVVWQLRRPWGFANANWSYHQARNGVDLWGVPGEEDRFLGFSPRKAAAAAGLHLGEAWTLGGSAWWLDRRAAYAWDPAAGANRLRTFGPDLVLGLNLTYAHRAFTTSLGVQDLTDRAVPFPQPYDGGHGPLPGLGREWVLKVRHGF